MAKAETKRERKKVEPKKGGSTVIQPTKKEAGKNAN